MTKIVMEIEVTKNGVPADSVVMSDPTGTFGARRQDTQEIVVADGVAMVQDASVPKRWTYTYNSAVPGVTYEWWAEVTFGTSVHHYEKVETAPASFEDDLVITVGDADAILQALVRSANRTGWDALPDADKAIELRSAQDEINAGFWNGVPVVDDQAFAFPRKIVSNSGTTYVGADTGGDADTVPDAVKQSIALIAWSMVDRADEWERTNARTGGGVVAHAGGGISESLTAISGGRSVAEIRLRTCGQAWNLLSPLWRRSAEIV